MQQESIPAFITKDEAGNQICLVQHINYYILHIY